MRACVFLSQPQPWGVDAGVEWRNPGVAAGPRGGAGALRLRSGHLVLGPGLEDPQQSLPLPPLSVHPTPTPTATLPPPPRPPHKLETLDGIRKSGVSRSSAFQQPGKSLSHSQSQRPHLRP